MNWNKAKNIVIVALVILNLVLLAVSSFTKDEYTLNAENEKAIISLLNKNGIYLSAEIPERFEPLPYLIMNKAQYDDMELKKIFFSASEEVKRSVEFEATIFRTDKKTLTIKENGISYYNENENAVLENLDTQKAQKEAEKIINAVMKNKNYELKKLELSEDKYYLKYYEVYLKNKVYNNSVDIVISKNGIESMELIRYDIAGFYGTNKKICSPDEALLAFLYELRDKKTGDILIDDVEIGYYFEEYNSQSRAVPCYRISLKNSKVYYVNAYTGNIV